MINYDEKCNKIAQLDYTITTAVLNGHKPHYDDKFKEIREELEDLRCECFGWDSVYCNPQHKLRKKKKGTK
jgi:hypothetical protein